MFTKSERFLFTSLGFQVNEAKSFLSYIKDDFTIGIKIDREENQVTIRYRSDEDYSRRQVDIGDWHKSYMRFYRELSALIR